jgi:hypothetical protein
MRFIFLPIFLFCLISCQALVPSESSMAAGMQLAKTRIVGRLRGCLKLPKPENGTELELSRTSARLISTSEGGGEIFEMEVVFDGRNFIARVAR